MAFIDYVQATPSTEDMLVDLARVHHFTADHLAANRKGKLHASQSTKLIKLGALKPLRTAGIVIGFAFLVRTAWAGYVEHVNVLKFVLQLVGSLALLDLGEFWKIYGHAGSSGFSGIMGKVLIGAPAAAIFGLRQLRMPMVLDAISGKVKSETGSVETASAERKARGKNAKEGFTEYDHYYAIGKNKYEVPPGASDVVYPGTVYRLYYAPKSRVVVAIEPVVGGQGPQ